VSNVGLARITALFYTRVQNAFISAAGAIFHTLQKINVSKVCQSMGEILEVLTLPISIVFLKDTITKGIL
jgi:hypothetical protein